MGVVSGIQRVPWWEVASTLNIERLDAVGYTGTYLLLICLPFLPTQQFESVLYLVLSAQ